MVQLSHPYMTTGKTIALTILSFVGKVMSLFFNLLTKVCIVKTVVFPVVMYRCESWTIKEPECQRIDALAVVLEKTVESPLDSKEVKPVNPKGNQS